MQNRDLSGEVIKITFFVISIHSQMSLYQI